MNIDKVNATLGKAIIHIQLNEAEELRSMMEGGGSDESSDFISVYVDSVAGSVSEAAEVDIARAGKVVIEAMEELSAKHPVAVKTTADLAAWATKVGLADEIARRLS